jgi:hypothetical protein
VMLFSSHRTVQQLSVTDRDVDIDRQILRARAPPLGGAAMAALL